MKTKTIFAFLIICPSLWCCKTTEPPPDEKQNVTETLESASIMSTDKKTWKLDIEKGKKISENTFLQGLKLTFPEGELQALTGDIREDKSMYTPRFTGQYQHVEVQLDQVQFDFESSTIKGQQTRFQSPFWQIESKAHEGAYPWKVWHLEQVKGTYKR